MESLENPKLWKKYWNKWEKFAAGRIIRGDLLRELRDAGHKLIPTQWIEVDKAEHKRRKDGPYVPPEFKSRLVACGNFEKTKGIRTDSPTADLEAINLLISCEEEYYTMARKVARKGFTF